MGNQYDKLSQPESTSSSYPSNPDLPNEIHEHIIAYLGYKSLGRAIQVCQTWQRMASNPHLWKRQMQVVYGIPRHLSPPLTDNCRFWYALVKKTHAMYKGKCWSPSELCKVLLAGHSSLADRLASGCPGLLTEGTMFAACSVGHFNIVKRIIIDLKYVSKTFPDGSSPIYLCAQEGFLDLVTLLVAHGADCEFKFEGNFTPLYIACRNGRRHVAEYLISIGANIETACRLGSTPLYIASQHGHLDTVILLIKSGANPQVVFKRGFSCLFIAAANGHPSVVKVLVSHVKHIDLADGDGSTALYVASQNGHAKCVELLIQAGANLEAIYLDCTPLYTACKNVHVKVVKLLCQHGAQVNYVLPNQSCPLHIAVQQRMIDICGVLLDHGANVNYLFNGVSLLSMAYREGHASITELLLSRGASHVPMEA